MKQRLFTFKHAHLANQNLYSPMGDGTMLRIDGEGYLRNVSPDVARKLSALPREYTLVGSCAEHLEFERQAAIYFRARSDALKVEAEFRAVGRAAYAAGVSIDELNQSLAPNVPKGDTLDLLAFLLYDGPLPEPLPEPVVTPIPAPKPEPVAAPKVDDFAEPPIEPLVIDPNAPPPVFSERLPDDLVERLDSMHWKAKVKLAQGLGAEMPAQGQSAAASAFLAQAHPDSLRAALAALAIPED